MTDRMTAILDRLENDPEMALRIIETVATDNTLAYEGDAGDDIHCVFCGGEEPWPRIPQDAFSGSPLKHDDKCIVLLARRFMGIPDELQVYQQDDAPEATDHPHEWHSIPGRYPEGWPSGQPWPWKRDYCSICYIIWEHA